MTKAKDKKIKSTKKSKMDKIHDKLIEKYEPQIWEKLKDGDKWHITM